MPLDSVSGAAPTAPVPMAEDRIVVACSPAELWRSLTTVPPLPRWSPVFRDKPPVHGGTVRPGAGRSWKIALGRRNGRVTGRCMAAVADTRLVYLLEPEAGPLTRFLSGLAFSFELEATEQGKTVLWLRTYYPSGGALGRLLRRPAMRRQFGALRMAMLRNLKRVAERTVIRSMPVEGTWHVRAVVPPVMLLTRER